MGLVSPTPIPKIRKTITDERNVPFSISKNDAEQMIEKAQSCDGTVLFTFDVPSEKAIEELERVFPELQTNE